MSNVLTLKRYCKTVRKVKIEFSGLTALEFINQHEVTYFSKAKSTNIFRCHSNASMEIEKT